MRNIKQILAENLVALRKNSGLTQNELAKKINYSDNAVSRWERGELLPSIEVLQSISEVYNVPIDSLLRENAIVDAKKGKKNQVVNKLATILLFVTMIWFLVVIVYVYSLSIFGLNLWRLFCWAVPVTCLILLPFNDVWGKYVYKFVIFSVFVWTTIACLYLQLLKYNMWLIFLVGVPAQVALVIWAFIKPKNK